jgi:UDP-glucose 4-epimerase
MTGDVSVPRTWETILPGVDYVFHLSGSEYTKGSNDGSFDDLRQNALPMLHLLEACRRHDWRPKIIFTSSANLFGRATVMPVNEDQCDDPLIPWAVHKLLAEYYLRLYREKYGLKSTILRLANVYGPTARPTAMPRVVINKLIADAMAGKPIMVYENHKCLRDYIFLADVVRALLLAGTDTPTLDGRVYIIGSGEGTRISDVCQQIVGQVRLRTGQHVQVHLDASVSVDAFDMRSFVADTGRFHRATGWRPIVALQEGINLTIESFMRLKLRHSPLSTVL